MNHLRRVLVIGVIPCLFACRTARHDLTPADFAAVPVPDEVHVGENGEQVINIPADQHRGPDDEFFWVRLTTPPLAPPPPPKTCWFDHSGEPPIDDDLVVYAWKTSDKSIRILNLTYKDPLNKAGQEFTFRYKDVPFSPPFTIGISVVNSAYLAHGFFDFRVAGKPYYVELCHTQCGNWGWCNLGRYPVP